jgi:excisionase family DNA binding protein
MIAIKPKSKSPKSAAPPASPSGESTANGDVLTLTETAHYLRVPEEEIVRLIQDQSLPGRLLGAEWRFLKSAIQDWLRSPPPKGSKEGIWALAGAWKDDPHLEEMLKEIYRKRGRPMSEDA